MCSYLRSHLKVASAHRYLACCGVNQRRIIVLTHAGGWIFGGVSDTSAGPSPRPFASLFAQSEINERALNDLWHWNGSWQKPAWSRIVQRAPSASASVSLHAWPPTWQAPLGWTSDVDGGELWLVGGSGAVKDADMLPQVSSSHNIELDHPISVDVLTHYASYQWLCRFRKAAIRCGDSRWCKNDGIIISLRL